jgi:hypothetical protein
MLKPGSLAAACLFVALQSGNAAPVHVWEKQELMFTSGRIVCKSLHGSGPLGRSARAWVPQARLRILGWWGYVSRVKGRMPRDPIARPQRKDAETSSNQDKEVALHNAAWLRTKLGQR